MAAQAQDLESVLRTLERSATSNGAKVSVDEIVETFGERSFGPLLLLCGLLGMTPLSAIPTMPTVLAVLAVLIAVQIVFGRRTVWVPRVIGRMSVKAASLVKAVHVAEKPAHVVDRVVRPRLCALTSSLGDRLVALACVAVALCVPPLELVPFAAFVPALAIFTFGVGMVGRDGLVLLIALALTAGAIGLIGWRLLG